MLTFEQFDKHLNVIKNQYIKERKISNSFKELGLCDDHVYLSVSEDIINNYINLIEMVMNDPNDINESWIQWHIYENDFGNNKMSVSCGKYKDKKIRNNKDIYNVILEWNKIKNK